MPRFRYQAVDDRDAVIAGEIDAASADEALARLRRDRLIPLAIETGERSGGLAWLPSLRSRARPADSLAIMRELAILVRSGLPMMRVLTVLRGLARRALVPAVERMQQAVGRGRSLSEAMAEEPGLFPERIRAAVAAGEAGGQLAKILETLVAGLERAKGLRDRTLSAVAYPAVVVIVMIGVMFIIIDVVLPRLAPAFQSSGRAMPWPTQLLLAIGQFAQDWRDLGAGLVILVLAGLLALSRWPPGRAWLDTVVIGRRFAFGLPRRIAAAELALNLGMLVEAGLPLDRALDHVRGTIGNGEVRRRLGTVLEAVRRGGRLAPELGRIALVPAVVVELAAVGEETGRLGTLLLEAAKILDDEITQRIERLSSLLPPLVTLLLGAAIAALMAGVVSGLLAINDLPS